MREHSISSSPFLSFALLLLRAFTLFPSVSTRGKDFTLSSSSHGTSNCSFVEAATHIPSSVSADSHRHTKHESPQPQQSVVLLVCNAGRSFPGIILSSFFYCSYYFIFISLMLYGLFFFFFTNNTQVYIVSKSVHRFTSYLRLSWPKNSPTYRELHVYVILTGIGTLLLPVFVISAIMRTGNMANDGTKIGAEKRRRTTLLTSFWRHTLPVAATLHAVSALCFFLPRIMIEGQLVSHGLLPRGECISVSL